MTETTTDPAETSAPSAPSAAPPPVPPLPDTGSGTCPRCGTPYEPAQEYCLECGFRLPLTRGLVTALAGVWTRRLPWYPGDWIWPALLALVIAALGATVAILATRDEPKQTLVATMPPGQTTPAATVGPTTETTPTVTETTATQTTATAPPPPPQPQAAPIEWPAGQRGYTIVLASIPTTSGRLSADRKAEEAIDAGVADVGILASSEYSSLHPGYYVVFSGVYDSISGAQDDLPAARSRGYEGAYARQIVP